MMRSRTVLSLVLLFALCTGLAAAEESWVEYVGKEGPGLGKHIVFLTGDEEYRSEEGMPMLAKILAQHHGFRCTVLFALDPETGEIDPNNQTHVVGVEKVAEADLVVMFFRFRELPDEDMKHIVDYLEAGKPLIALRTSTHAFNYSRNKESPYAKYSFRSQEWPGGFGRQVLGETWVNHHGHHGKESTRGVVDGLHRRHPILRGVKDIWGPTDVYGIRSLPEDADVLVHGLSLAGMTPDSPPNHDKSLMPVAWVRSYARTADGPVSRNFCTTMGASTDLVHPGLRRLLVNACYWGVGLEDSIAGEANVEIVGDYEPTPFGFNSFVEGVKPGDHAHPELTPGRADESTDER